MTTVKAQEKHVTVNGVRLRYLDWGNAGNTPLVCLHGHTGQAHIWDEFAQAMSSHYHVLAVDQRGHGGSQWADSGYARDRFVEDLAAFVDALGLSRFVLAGLSMEDGHTASLFPGSVAIQEQTRLVSEVRVEQLSADRITITFPVINNALNVIVLVSGRSKASIFQKVLEEENHLYPAQLINPTSGHLHWFVDIEAASQLRALPHL